MNAQIPIPSFEDIRKIFSFWFDQQDKWFYFEGEMFQAGILGRVSHSPPNLHRAVSPWQERQETTNYTQLRIVGRIKDVVSYPPSLLLIDVLVFTVLLSSDNLVGHVKRYEKRPTFGLVFSQITYYEPIRNIGLFLQEDSRVKQDTV